jgi:hypothetical protein
MEAVPLSEHSNMRMSVYISRISRFGLPETISNDRRPQFTSNDWSQLCEMLNITHRQTTNYHPKENRAVESSTAASRMHFVLAPLR